MAVLPLIAVQLVYAVATATGLSLVGMLWRTREKSGARSLAVANIGLAIWSGSLLGIAVFGGSGSVPGIGVTGDTLARLFHRFMYVGIVLGSTSIFVFALEYSGRERYVTPRTLTLLAVHPVVTIAFVVVNPGNVFFADVQQMSEVFLEDPTVLWGPGFYVHTVYSYLLLAGVVGMMLELLFSSKRPLYRGQAAALLGGTVPPVLLNAAYLFGPFEFDSTPIGFLASTALFTLAIVRYQLIDITPIAREKVVENVRDGMFVVDTDDQIIDTNPAFGEFTETDPAQLVGMEAPRLFSEYPELVSAYEEMTAGTQTTERRLSYSNRYVNVEATPIRDDREKLAGWLFLVHDVTELVQRERDLEQQVEKLDQFAGIVSHDLRNPLNVAQGYVQHVRATGETEYLEKTEDAMDRMEAIIQDALALAREGEKVTQPEPVDLESVTHSAWENVETDGASITVESAPIVADRARLQRLLENLFRNSLEHGIPDEQTPADHRIDVGVSTDDTRTVTIYVADNGVGIPESKLDTVFESGYTTNEDGTGLGLAIVEQIARAHGWEVTATHSDSGGAQFKLHEVAQPVGGRPGE